MKASSLILCIVVALGVYQIWFRNLPPPPAPVPVAAPVPTPTPRRLAADGVYFPLQYLSTFTKTGVIGFAPGQPLQFVEAHGIKWLMTDGQHQFEVDPASLTNDLDIAASVAASDEKTQTALAAQQIRDMSEAQRREEAALLRTPTPAAPQQRSQGHNPLDDRATRTNGGHAVTSHPVYVDRYGYPVNP